MLLLAKGKDEAQKISNESVYQHLTIVPNRMKQNLNGKKRLTQFLARANSSEQ